jgi:hypothetical protein
LRRGSSQKGAESSIPWRRVLAEGLVIVASILVALTADAWRTELQERRGAQEYLARLAVDLEGDLSIWTLQASRSQTKLASLEGAMAWVRAPSRDQAAIDQFLDDLIQGSRMAYGVAVSPNRTTFDELVSVGERRLLAPAVRQSLVAYHNTVRIQRDRLESRETDYAATVFALVPRDPEFVVKPDLTPAERARIAERALG